MTFKELYLSGQVPFEEIDRYISRWNRSDDERTLAKYLGLNADEEDVWIDDSDEALKEMLDARERVAGTTGKCPRSLFLSYVNLSPDPSRSLPPSLPLSWSQYRYARARHSAHSRSSPHCPYKSAPYQRNGHPCHTPCEAVPSHHQKKYAGLAARQIHFY